MLLNRDASIQLYGMNSWVCVFPWDPMALDVPERITPLLEEEFLAQWAQPHDRDDRDDPSGDALIVLPDLGPGTSGAAPPGLANGSRRKAGPAPSKRRIANAKERAEAAQQELELVEGELRAASQRRHGYETWALLVEERLKAAHERLEEAAAAARAEEARLAEVQQQLEEAREAVQLTGADAEAARRRVEAAGRSLRAARSVRRMRRTEDELEALTQAVEEARRAERTCAEELANRQSVLDRAMRKIEDATKTEAEMQRQVTAARRKAARASLTLANLMEQIQRGPNPEGRTPMDAASVIADADQAETEAREAKARLIAAAQEVRSVAEMVASAESRTKAAQGALVEAHERAERADAAVRELEVALARTEREIEEAQPALAEAEAEAHASTDRMVAARHSVTLGRRAWRLRRGRRHVRSLTASLEVARAQAAEAHSRLDELNAELREAKELVKQGRGVEAETRRSLGEARRRLGYALGTLTRMRWAAGRTSGTGEEGLQHLIIARYRAVIGSLSFDEWARRASGHWRVPRFVLEANGEAIWLYRGDWIVADPSLTLDDLAVLEDGSEEVAPSIEGHGSRGQGLDVEAVQFIWERDGGRCAQCGSLANLVIDHVIPVYLGGGETASNLQLLCRNCSREKSHQL